MEVYQSFKPYYKWNTFNTKSVILLCATDVIVLNLIINGIPSIQLRAFIMSQLIEGVLNLIINGIPSIQYATYATSAVMVF